MELNARQLGAFERWPERSESHVARIERTAELVREHEVELDPLVAGPSPFTGLHNPAAIESLRSGGGEEY